MRRGACSSLRERLSSRSRRPSGKTAPQSLRPVREWPSPPSVSWKGGESPIPTPPRNILKPRHIMTYKVALRHTDEGYSVSCPGLPGCWPQGATEPEALENIQDAIREYLAAAAELIGGLTEEQFRKLL